jgi:putative transposase
MTFAFIREHTSSFPVRLLCAVLDVSPSGFYAWRSRKPSRRAVENEGLAAEIRTIHAGSHGRYGSPRVHAELRRRGRHIGIRRVERVMRQHGIRGIVTPRRRPRTTDSRHGLPVAPNWLGRNFSAERPNQVWAADLTYIPTAEGWLYLAAIIDLCTRKIVGWAMRDTLHAEIVRAALAMAVQRQRPAPVLIHHSDRGVQGGFKWSSQHPGGGGCDGHAETALGSGGTRHVAVARTTGRGSAREPAAVLGGDCGGFVE